jgi:transposase-like protein
MKRRQWDSKTKAMIVLQGLRGKPITEICKEHQIAQTQYYQWRDQFLNNAPKIFDPDISQRESKLQTENAKLKHMIGELTMELKKSEDDWS